MPKKIRLTALLLTVGALMLTVAPCFAQTETKGSIRLVNASPDSPALDFYFNQAKTYTGLKFKDVSKYADISNGTYDIKAFASPSDGTGKPVFEVPNFTVNNGSISTVVTVGLVKNNSVTALPLSDNNWLTADVNNKAKVRFIHGSPDAPAVDVQVAGLGDIFNNISFKSIGSYVTVPAGALALTVKSVANPDSVVLTKSLNVDAGKVYSVFVVGELSSSGLDTVIAVDRAVSSMPSTGQGSLSPASFGGSEWMLVILAGLVAVSGAGYVWGKVSPKRA